MIKEYLTIIGKVFPSLKIELEDGLKENSFGQSKFDEALIRDIGVAVNRWIENQPKLVDPYCVWYFNRVWTPIVRDLTQADAYKEWYKLTKGATQNHKPEYSEYYVIESAFWKPEHLKEEEEEDDFSIKYLLEKTFGG